jgi:predicted AlkP superfamily phosphohydrolase/phosphomutase
MSFRLNVAIVAAGLMIGFVAAQMVFSQPPAQAQEKQGRVIILGFDGVDPGITQTMLDKGELPNLKKLQEQGGFQKLGSSNPPQSPTAWSSFSTCKTPLNHGIYDFLKRTPKTYIPGIGFGRALPAKLNADGSVAEAPAYVNNRKGDTFWKAASDQGMKVKALVVPFAYPAEDLSDECLQLCGLDVPDIRGTQSTYFAMSESFAKAESVPGGMRLPLAFTDNKATVQVPGIAKPGTREYIEVPVSVTVDRDAQRVDVEVEGQKASLKEGEWSEWLEWSFAVSPKYTVRAITRFHVMEAGEEVRLYMTCLQFHPKDPYIRMSTPAAFSGELAERHGLFKTIGWVYDTKALQQGDMTEEMFLEDVERTMAWREQLFLDEFDRGGFDMLIGAWTATDRVGHMFWAYRDPKHPLYTEEMAAKYGDAVERTYRKMDSIVGKAMERMQPNDLLMVMSDHGFHSFRKGFSVNTWLIRNGYLAVKGQTDAATAFTDEKYLQGYDWSKSKAYGLGLGMIFLNLQGREGQGTVAPGEAKALAEEIREKLLQETDPETGDKIFSDVYLFTDAKGAAVEDAPDLQLGYAEGYQTEKASAAGAAPKALFEPNLDKWSGEHASSDVANTAGILFSNKALKNEANLTDLGVTALQYLGGSVPADYEGKGLL